MSSDGGTGPVVTTRRAGRMYLVDTSVWARVPLSEVVRDRLDELRRLHTIVTATPLLLELGFSARSPAEWEAVMAAMAPFPVLPMSEGTHQEAIAIQRALWRAGKVRAAGAFDVLVAALAVQHAAWVLHFDADYEHIAAAEPRLRQEWVVPRGGL